MAQQLGLGEILLKSDELGHPLVRGYIDCFWLAQWNKRLVDALEDPTLTEAEQKTKFEERPPDEYDPKEFPSLRRYEWLARQGKGISFRKLQASIIQKLVRVHYEDGLSGVRDWYLELNMGMGKSAVLLPMVAFLHLEQRHKRSAGGVAAPVGPRSDEDVVVDAPVGRLRSDAEVFQGKIL